MSTAPMFDPYGNELAKEKRPRSWLATCVIGCLVIAVALIVLGVAAIYFISHNLRGWVSTFSASSISQVVDASNLPPQEKLEIKQQVDRLAQALRNGQVTGDQMGRVFQKVMESPLLTTINSSTAEHAYFDKSGLSDDEKTEGKKSLQRFLRGNMDGAISKNALDSAMTHVADRQPNGNWELRDRVTDEQLRAFLAAAKSSADAVNIPEEPAAFDPSDEVKRLVDEAVNEPANRNEPAEMENRDDTNEPGEQPREAD